MSNQPSDPKSLSPSTDESSPTQEQTQETQGAVGESAATSETSSEQEAMQATANEAGEANASASGVEAKESEASGSVPNDSTASSDSDAEKKRVAIGSQRDDASVSTKPKAVTDAESAPAAIDVPEEFKQSTDDATSSQSVATPPPRPVSTEPVPVPSLRDKPDEIEREIDQLVGDISMQDVVSDSSGGGEEIELDGRYKGTVTRVHNDNVFFALKNGVEGFAPVKQFKKEPEIGLMTDVIVKRFNEEDGLYELSIPGASVSVEDWSEIEVGTVVEARVTGSNTGGLECMVKNIRGFIPASQIAMHRVENLGDYVNKKLTCVITEAKPKRKNLVLSHRRVLEKELAEVRKESMAKLQPGAIVEGKVTRLREFGAFVDIGGVEGLVHISKLSWDRVEKPSDVVEEGQAIKVKIEKVNPESGKISLSYRDTVEHPWENVESQFPAEAVVKGTVTRIAPFGAFVRVAPGVEGLVHISELAHRRVVAVTNVVSEGEEVEVKILSVDRGSQKMALSIKANLPVPEKETTKKEVVEEESSRELAVKKRKKPLKGGMDRRSGGDDFGLKW